ncbi:hypothetical protein FRC12_014052 [Ceratobasidium sp. 428]|nr:hypothetical protein FRC12_014052 [Ceratobasidium sp. 428]
MPDGTCRQTVCQPRSHTDRFSSPVSPTILNAPYMWVRFNLPAYAMYMLLVTRSSAAPPRIHAYVFSPTITSDCRCVRLSAARSPRPIPLSLNHSSSRSSRVDNGSDDA